MDEAVTMVVFDLGGVVVRICRSWQEACRAAGVEHRVGMDDPLVQWNRREVVKRFERGEIASEEFFARVAATTDGLYGPDEVRRVHSAWLIDEYPGVDALVDDLHRAGIETGILSNTNHTHWEIMGRREPEARYPTLWRTSHPHASHLLGLAKPDRAIYDEFARRSGRVGRTASIIFFDDLQENVDAARAAGWRSERIDHTGDPASQMRAYLREHAVVLGDAGAAGGRGSGR
jgi:HAD superfamily hydrolase (TIGR01509 family)